MIRLSLNVCSLGLRTRFLALIEATENQFKDLLDLSTIFWAAVWALTIEASKHLLRMIDLSHLRTVTLADIPALPMMMSCYLSLPTILPICFLPIPKRQTLSKRQQGLCQEIFLTIPTIVYLVVLFLAIGYQSATSFAIGGFIIVSRLSASLALRVAQEVSKGMTIGFLGFLDDPEVWNFAFRST